MEKKTTTKKPTIESLQHDIETTNKRCTLQVNSIIEANKRITEIRLMAESHGDEIDSIKDTLEDIENRLKSIELHGNNHENDNNNELRELRKNVDYCLEKLGERVEKCEKAIEQFAARESNPAEKPTVKNPKYIDPAKVAALIDKGISVRMKLTLMGGEFDINAKNCVWLLSNHYEKYGNSYDFYDSEHKCTCRIVSPCDRHILEAYELKEIPIS
jgi:DNA repair exonuclease SbcCD ATPase subunit